MISSEQDPVLNFSNKAHKVSFKTLREREEVWVGQADLTGAEILGADPGIYDGMCISSNGVARVAYDHSNKCFLLLAGKAPDILQGARNGEGIFLTEDTVKRGYIVSAYRSTLGNSTPFSMPGDIARKMKNDWADFRQQLSDRAQKHFTLYHASVNNLSPNLNAVLNVSSHTEILTNGRFFYTLDKNAQGRFDVRFYAPTRRQDGSFVSVPLGENHLFNKVSKYICRDASYAQARHEIAVHWGVISSKLWDEKNVYQGEGLGFKAKKTGATVMNWPKDNVGAIGRSAAFGGIIGIQGDTMTAAWAALVGAMTHMAFDEGIKGGWDSWKGVREARAKTRIEDYGFSEDASDYYKIQTVSHIKRLCAKMDIERCKPENIRFLPLSETNMRLAHAPIEDGMRPMDIRGLILSMDQRGFSSITSFPDTNTKNSAYQNGLMILRNTSPNKPDIFYAKYRGDVCMSDVLDLPDHYKEQIGEGIMRIEYDPRARRYTQAFNDISFNVSLDEMMARLSSERLFEEQPGIDVDTKEQSLSSVEGSFAKPNFACYDYMEETQDLGYMSGQPSVPPNVLSLEE